LHRNRNETTGHRNITTMETTTTHEGMDKRKRFADPMDILSALPCNIVADIIYPLGVYVIKDRNHLISAVEFYFDESYQDSYLCRRYPIGQWDVEPVSDFSDVFDETSVGLRNFNEDVSSWNVANATNLSRMFRGCVLFNSDVSRWNVAKVETFESMFEDCTLFNSDVSRWNVASAFNFSSMFSRCKVFNSDVSQWNMARADYVAHMFYECRAFNSDVSRWNLRASDYGYMFYRCYMFESDVSGWDANPAFLYGYDHS
jgi:surface protein